MATKIKQSANLRQTYLKETVPALQKELGLNNALAVPRVEKVIINVGIGRFTKDEKMVNAIVEDLTKITGQRPVKTVARKAIAGFKIREGNIVGVKATLRGARMYEFLQRLLGVALPRVRDFRGISAEGFDGEGNYSLGLSEHIVFPEVSTDAVEHVFPLQITVVTTAKNVESGYKLLKSLGFPFKDESKK
ncbi:MAG: 50S ribosomal protein L5 [Candidatus Doudnabacteria bacterium RIFCSPHIGHO2_02_FULL_46_11]|uniref:Large ribosomal subunit protein uL5 n=1 Tax=Candidatus Doudnabacteria bacterium RIFCSPHIGHO2_02_FULL_46_11 TaxID=1817832 RepID=A0A1F5P5B9_9BACT|nr:ribosomal protein L5 [uncultured bacterium]OGE85103.1 MAG: 50S ribosomal protein L5 [Candidatus Doudnabacteria bacterium RIFCSPHIGHO2_02_FULL_46_11]